MYHRFISNKSYTANLNRRTHKMSASASSSSSLCTNCYKVLSRPCEIVDRVSCSGCHGRLVPCNPGAGRGWIPNSRSPDNPSDCDVCRRTGLLVACSVCGGGGIQYDLNGNRFPCQGCSGNGGRICTTCHGSRTMLSFVQLCRGDVFADQRRSHTNEANLRRKHWDRFVRNDPRTR